MLGSSANVNLKKTPKVSPLKGSPVGRFLLVLLVSFIWEGPFLLAAPRPRPVAGPLRMDHVSGLAKSRRVSVIGHVPLWFEPNDGQFPLSTRFAARTNSYSLYMLQTQIVLRPFQHPEHIAGSQSRNVSRASSGTALLFVGANRNSQIVGVEKLQSISNYFNGSDPSHWHSRISNYSRVEYRNLYPGIDLICRGEQSEPEFDWIVKPGANASQIRISIRGSNPIIDHAGALLLKLQDGEVRLKKPVIYQEIEGIKQFVKGRFALKGNHQIIFKIGNFDRSRPLVIDPALVYSTYLGGSNDDETAQISVDSSGNAYVIGTAQSNDYPLVNPLQANKTGFYEAFVTKFDPSGSNVIYSTYIGGTAPGHVDRGNTIVVDSSGNALLAGQTNDLNFPTTPGAYLSAPGGVGLCGNCTDGWVAKLDPTGSSLLFSTYLTGNGNNIQSPVSGVAFDALGNVYVTGTAYPTGFPITPGAYNVTSTGTLHVFITKLNSNGSALVYSSYFGGNGIDQSFGIAIDSADNAYVTGLTSSTDFPVTTLLQWQSEPNQAFVLKLNASGSQMMYSTLFGSGEAFGIAVDNQGSAYITGFGDDYHFPTAGPMKTNFQDDDAFVSKLDPSGTSLVYSIFLGGSDVDQGNGIAVDSGGNAYVTGRTQSADFPTVEAIQTNYSGGTLCAYNCSDAFVTVVSSDGSHFLFSTYLGDTGFDVANGIAIDSSGSIYVTGVTTSLNFPLGHPYQAIQKGAANSFVTKISNDVSITPQRLVFGPAPLGTFQRQGLGIRSIPQILTFTNNTISSITFTTNTFEGTNPTEFSLVSDNCANSVVQTSGTCTITVAFNPAGVGVRQANLKLNNSAQQAPFIVSLLGYGSPVIFAPTALAFGLQTPGSTSAAQTLTVTNSGQSALTIGSITTGGDAPQFFPIQRDACTGTTLSANASCSISISFSPVIIGHFSAVLSVNDTAGDNPQYLLITGIGTGPEVTFSMYFLNFPNQQAGTVSAPQSAILTNSGSAPLIITGIVSTVSDFSQTNNCNSPIAVGGTCAVQISFTPSRNGALSGAIQVSDNALGSPQQVELGGNGGAGPSTMVISPSQLNYGNQPVGSISPPQVLMLRNVGTAGVNITSASTTANFTQTNNCPSVMPPGANCSIDVTFAPTAAGQINGLFSLTFDGVGSPQTVSLGGLANDFALAVSPLNSSVMDGNSASYTLTVSPLGGTFSSPISLGCSSLPRGMVCAFNPVSVTPGTSSQQLTLTISTTASGIASRRERPWLPPIHLAPVLFAMISVWCLTIQYVKKLRRIGALVILFIGLCLLYSCGGTNSVSLSPSTGTPPGTYAITVTGNSGSLTHSQSINLTVR
jgi:Beta-propeller repeat/Abnormal spindle-like microcephaly-assoc'd, ASPM-SPD-2-Hydin